MPFSARRCALVPIPVHPPDLSRPLRGPYESPRPMRDVRALGGGNPYGGVRPRSKPAVETKFPSALNRTFNEITVLSLKPGPNHRHDTGKSENVAAGKSNAVLLFSRCWKNTERHFLQSTEYWYCHRCDKSPLRYRSVSVRIQSHLLCLKSV